MSIIDISLRDLYKRLLGLGYTLTLSEEARKFVADKGFDPQFGARPLHRAIQKYIEDPLAEFILNENLQEGTVLRANLNEETQLLEILVDSNTGVESDVKE